MKPSVHHSPCPRLWTEGSSLIREMEKKGRRRSVQDRKVGEGGFHGDLAFLVLSSADGLEERSLIATGLIPQLPMEAPGALRHQLFPTQEGPFNHPQKTVCMLCKYHTIFQCNQHSQFFSIIETQLCFFYWASDKIFGVHLRAMLCEKYVCCGCCFPKMWSSVCKLNVSVTRLHYGATEVWGYSEFDVVMTLVDGRNDTSLLPQERPGIHSVLNHLNPKMYWFTRGSSLLLLSKCPPTLLTCPGGVNIWGCSKSGEVWISVTTLPSNMSPLYQRRKTEDRTETAQTGFHWCHISPHNLERHDTG